MRVAAAQWQAVRPSVAGEMMKTTSLRDRDSSRRGQLVLLFAELDERVNQMKLAILAPTRGLTQEVRANAARTAASLRFGAIAAGSLLLLACK